MLKNMVVWSLCIAFCALWAGPSLATAAPQTAKPYGDWVLKCTEIGKDKSKSCLVTQTVTLTPKDPKKGQNVNVMGIAVGYSGKQTKPQIAFQVSGESELKAGLTLQVDQGDAFAVPIDACSKQRCVARDFLSENVEKAMLTGTKLSVTYKLLNQKKRIVVPVSLKGFKEAMEALNADRPKK